MWLVNAEDLDDATLKSDGSDMKANVVSPVQEESEQLTARLHNTARDPYAEGKTSGVAFEEAIAEIFNFMGFNDVKHFCMFNMSTFKNRRKNH